MEGESLAIVVILHIVVGIFDILVAVYALIGAEVIDMLEDKFCLGVNFSIFCCKILGGTLVARKEQLWIFLAVVARALL